MENNKKCPKCNSIMIEDAFQNQYCIMPECGHIINNSKDIFKEINTFIIKKELKDILGN